MKNKTTYSFKEKIKKGEVETTYVLTFAKMRRSLREESDIQYSKKFHEFIKRGLLPAAALQNAMIDSGAVIGEESAKKYEAIVERLATTASELENLSVDLENKEKNAAKIAELTKDYTILEQRAREYELSRFSSSEHTAEKHAHDAVVQWIMLKCAMIKEDKPDAEFAPFFKGITDAELLADLEEKEYQEDELYTVCLERFYLMAALAKRGIESPERIEQFFIEQGLEVAKKESQREPEIVEPAKE